MEDKQEWRVYAPEGRDTSYDTKSKLRTQNSMATCLKEGHYIKPACVATGSDDAYLMNIANENIMVLARESGQIDHIPGVFDEAPSGIFLRVSAKNFREAEGRLTKIFGNN
ncbi:MAG: hypothetical protein WCI72_05220 [archaeon]